MEIKCLILEWGVWYGLVLAGISLCSNVWHMNFDEKDKGNIRIA